MNFDLSEEQQALAGLAAQVFGGIDSDRVAIVDRSEDRVDHELWATLAASQLLGVVVPQEHGGLGFGMVELCLVLEQQGAALAPVPLLATLAYGALPLSHFGSPELAAHYLPQVAAGTCVLTGAFAERGANDITNSSVTATPDNAGGWRLAGEKLAVPAITVADAILVPAETPAGLTVFLVPIDAAGLEIGLNVATDRQILGSLVFDGVVATQTVGAVGQGVEVAKLAVDRIQLGGSALVLGCCTTATKMAAAYTNEREQFGRPLSTYQGAQLRAADCVIDTHGIRLTLLQAAWRLDQGLDADDAIAVAKYWSAEAGQRVVHNTQHLHGGMGADVDYPVHRTFLWVKQLECTFGAGSQQLARLGASIAASAVG